MIKAREARSIIKSNWTASSWRRQTLIPSGQGKSGQGGIPIRALLEASDRRLQRQTFTAARVINGSTLECLSVVKGHKGTLHCSVLHLFLHSSSPLGQNRLRHARPESEPEAVRRAGGGPGDDQAVLPRRRHRTQDELRQQVGGPQVAAARALALHADDGRSHQDFRGDAEKPG